MSTTFYEYDQNRVSTGKSWTPEPKDPIPRNWTHIAPPETPGFHIFDGHKWFTREQYPVVHRPTPAPTRHITRLAFLSRFTDEEAIAIDLASIGTTIEAAAMRRYLSKVEAASFIDLDREDTRLGVLTLESVGILTEGRATEILDKEIEPHEVSQ